MAARRRPAGNHSDPAPPADAAAARYTAFWPPVKQVRFLGRY